jgi:hypothetical protein
MNPAPKKQPSQEISLPSVLGELLLEAETRASTAEARIAENTEQLSKIGSSLTSEKENTTRLTAALEQARTEGEANRTAFTQAMAGRSSAPDNTPVLQQILNALRIGRPAQAATTTNAAPFEPPEYEMRVVGRDLNNRPQRILLTPRKKP